MTTALNKRIRRVLLANKSQYLGSMVLILFSSFMLTLMTHFAMNFERLADEFQSLYVQEDASFTTDLPIENLQALESAGDAIIEEGLSFDAVLPAGQTLRVFQQNQRVNIPAITEGGGLQKSGDLLINSVFAAANGYEIGDQITLQDRSFTVTGFMALPHYMYPIQSEDMLMYTNDFGTGVIGGDDFAGFDQVSRSYAVKFREADVSGVEQAVQFKELLKNQGIGITQWTDVENNRRVNLVGVEVQVLKIMSQAVPGGILVLVSIMVANVVGRMIQRETEIIGALYALGYKRREIHRHYMVFPLLIAVTGGVTGTILGVFPIRFAVSFMLSVFIIPLTGIELAPLVFLVSLLLPVLLLGGSGYLVIRKTLKASPVELMRGRQADYQVNFLERVLRLERFKFATKFVLREQLRSLSRLAFLLAGVVVATMLLLWGLALKSGFDYILTNGLTSTYDFVYEYKFDSLQDAPLPAGAEPVSAALFLQQGVENKDFYITGVIPDSPMLTLADDSGVPLSTNQVVATRPLANQFAVEPGGFIQIIRKVDGRQFGLRVDAIAETYSGKFLFMPLSDYNAVFEMPPGSYTGAFSNVILELPEDVSYSMVSLEEKLAGVEEAIAPTEMMIGFLAFVAFIIGVIVIYVVTAMLVEENRQSISLMKIFGYHQKEINTLILNSSTIVVVAGYLLGIPLLLAGLGAILQVFEDSIGLTLPPGRIDPLYLLAGFMLVMGAFQISKRLCQKKVNAVSMSEALKLGTE